MLKQVSHALDPVHAESLFAGLDQLERNTRDLQEAVIGVRMLPVDAVFRRFPRLVRDLSSRLGKQVRLRTVGEGTELDKGLIEKIADPLVHLVRNSIDHGLEMPDVRRGAGKDETGTITLAASHQGGHIVIEVSDDGRGPTAPRSRQGSRTRPGRAGQPDRFAGLGPDLPAASPRPMRSPTCPGVVSAWTWSAATSVHWAARCRSKAASVPAPAR